MRLHQRVVLLLGLFFVVVLWHMQRASLSLDEAHTAWIIRDDIRQTDSLGEWMRGTIESLKSTLNRARHTSSIPLYYLLLDGWSRLVGESELALRYPAALLGIIMLAAVYRIGTQVFNRRIGLIALFILGTGAYFMFYGRDARIGSANPDWRESVLRIADIRTTSEAGIMFVAPDHPLTHYARHTTFADGITLNLGWRPFTVQEVQNVAAYLEGNSSVWAFLDMHLPQSWAALATLDQGRGVGYRDSMAGTILYRFDAESDESLTFQFGRDNPVPVTWHYRTYTVGDVICPADFALDNVEYTVQISLMRETADPITAADECLTVPDEVGHVRLSLLDRNGQHLPIIEQGHEWGDFLIVGAVTSASN